MNNHIVKIHGGLGNQMFQYAFYLYLKKKYENVYIDLLSFNNYKHHNGFELDKIFNLSFRIKNVFQFDDSPFFFKRIKKRLYRLVNNKFEFISEKKLINLNVSNKNYYYCGYWQDLSFINHNLNAIFALKKPLDNHEIINFIKSNYCISIHIRRGDYINHPYLTDLTKTSYYEEAIRHFRKKNDRCTFIVFSNDIIWCKNQFKEVNFIFIDFINPLESYKEIFLMSLCQDNIIANSTFSWWGAWLNSSESKHVIAPRNWFSNDRPPPPIYDKKWILL